MGTAVIATLDTHQISNSVCIGNEKPQAMQWIAPKQMSTPSIMILVVLKLFPVLFAQNLGTLSSWLRLTSPSRLPVINPNIITKPSKTDFYDSFCTSELDWDCVLLGSDSPDFWNTQTGWLKRCVPPKDIYHEIHGCICKCDNFEVCDWEVFNAMRNALHYEPWCLKEDKGLGKQVAFAPVLDFCLCRHGKWVDIIMHKVTCE